MHLTPEQIERQPFRMRRRGYDIVQVRAFLRGLAAQLRGSVIDSPDSGSALRSSDLDDAVVDAARAEASRIIAVAERTARERSAVVLAETQARLDELLEEERRVRDRLVALEHAGDVADLDVSGSADAIDEDVPAPDGSEIVARPNGDGLAAFLQSAVRSGVEADELGSEDLE